MTTIAFKDGIIAVDGMACCGDVVYDLNANKFYERNGTLFWLSSQSNEEEFIDAFIGGNKVSVDGICCGFVRLPSGQLMCAVTHEENGVVSWKHDTDMPWAYGCGDQFAIGAMDAGASAEEAIHVASKRSVGTGGTIRVYDVFSGKQIK